MEEQQYSRFAIASFILGPVAAPVLYGLSRLVAYRAFGTVQANDDILIAALIPVTYALAIIFSIAALVRMRGKNQKGKWLALTTLAFPVICGLVFWIGLILLTE